MIPQTKMTQKIQKMPTNPPLRLSIFGPPSAGKTALANEMSSRLGGVKMSFADALRHEVSVTQGIDMGDLVNVPEKYKYRKLLQEYGAKRRAQDSDYWVHALEDEFEALWGETSVVVDDMRYMNEHQMLRSQGFTMVRLQPRGQGHEGHVEANRDELLHESERDWPFFTFDIKLRWVVGVEARADHLIELLARL